MLSLSRDAAKRIDEYFIDSMGVPRDILIEHAAAAVAGICVARLAKQGENSGDRVFPTIDVFAGKGMNGLDAFACARHLTARGLDVVVWEVFTDRKGETPWQIQAVYRLGIPVRPAENYRIRGKGMIVDGIFGTAFSAKKPFPPALKKLFQKINVAHASGNSVIAVDLPSGVEADTGETVPCAIEADETVTFICPKTGIMTYPGRKYAGKIHIERIGFSLQTVEKALSETGADSRSLPVVLDAATVRPWFTKRPPDGHKGTFGSAGLIGGSEGMAGAICLAAAAAMRCGVGLTYVRVPSRIKTNCLTAIPEALISSDYEPVFEKTDAVAIGPGLDRTKSSVCAVWKAIGTVLKLVLDAGALTVIARFPQEAEAAFQDRNAKGLPPVLMTPHPGEFARLMPDFPAGSRLDAAKAAAKRYEAVVILKGAGTVIADPQGRVFINTTGSSAMAKGGSGDVLSGILVSFLAQGKDPFTAAAAGVFFHGLCGDLAARELGEYAAIPGDFIRKIPDAFRILEDTDITKEQTVYE